MMRALWRSPNFYPRPPRGGRHYTLFKWGGDFYISTHALREEGDLLRMGLAIPIKISTHALREEGDLRTLPEVNRRELISTHALREEGDPCRRGRRPQDRISTHALREEGDRWGSPSAR